MDWLLNLQIVPYTAIIASVRYFESKTINYGVFHGAQIVWL